MTSRLTLRLFGTALIFLASGSMPALANPWAEIARTDALAIHDLLRDNHPGPADPANPAYREWLERGLPLTLKRAESTTSYDEYLRTLEFYTNGFSDDHVALFPSLTESLLSWSGFLVSADPQGVVRVTVAEEDSGVRVGDTLSGCDGKSLDALLKERTDPYFWNAEIPHARLRQVWRLFYQGRNDPQHKYARCKFSSGTVTLSWRTTNLRELQPKLDAAQGLGGSELALRKIAGVWMATIPTFNFQTPAQIAGARAFVEALQANIVELRKGTLVLDVRGNEGGNSSWADQILAIIWGRDWIDHIESQFDETVNWRASPANLDALERNREFAIRNKLPDNLAYYTQARDAMKSTLDKGEPFATVAEESSATPQPASNSVTGRVYLFTDGACASSCLIFADVLRRLPGVTHIGFATYADTAYIDNTSQLLPSGLAYLSYSLKVYRKRVRANNEWYEPQIKWPGGTVNDQTIAKWVAALR